MPAHWNFGWLRLWSEDTNLAKKIIVPSENIILRNLLFIPFIMPQSKYITKFPFFQCKKGKQFPFPLLPIEDRWATSWIPALTIAPIPYAPKSLQFSMRRNYRTLTRGTNIKRLVLCFIRRYQRRKRDLVLWSWQERQGKKLGHHIHFNNTSQRQPWNEIWWDKEQLKHSFGTLFKRSSFN